MKWIFSRVMPSLLVLASLQSENQELDALELKIKQLKLLTEKERKGCCSPTGYENSCGDVSLSLDLLYWHPKTDFTELGSTMHATAIPVLEGGSTSYIDFNWAFGFKAGLGYHFDARSWDLFAEYTRIEFSDSFTFNAGASRLALPNFGAVSGNVTLFPVSFIKCSHHITYQTATLTLSKDFFVRRKFVAKPGFGLKATWINQIPHIINNLSRNTPNLDQHVFLSEKTSSLGPQSNLYLSQDLCNGWSLYSQSGFALLFTRYRGRMRVEGDYSATNPYPNDPDFRQSNKEDKHYVCMNIALALGIQYKRCFVEKRQNVTVSLGYESQYYLNQSYLMQNRRVQEEEVYQGAMFGRSLSVYGLTARASYEF